jgi:hypothetical protein
MTLYEIAALLSRHIVAVAAVLLLAAGAGYSMVTAPPVYSESGSLVFATSGKPAQPASAPYGDSSALIGQSLITTETTAAVAVSSSQASARVRAAGGTAEFAVTPFNTYSLQYPDYARPIATLAARSPRPDATHRTFWLVFRLVQQRLAASETRAGTPAKNRIKVYLVADTGPELVSGSRARTIGGLGALTVVATFVLASALDRRRKPSGRRRSGRGTRSAAATLTAPADR